MRRLILKIKRFFFKTITGISPVELRRLVYIQKYLDKGYSKSKSYNEYLAEHFNKNIEVKHANFSR